ncbi:hypothetical protein Hanom_Chr06g00561341 [Helianthus anomalus]
MISRNCSWLVLLSCFWLDEVSGPLSLSEWSEFEVKLVCEDLRAAMIYAWVCNTYRSRPHVLCLKFTSMWMLCRFTKSKNHRWCQT